jgi:hypothetical protein
VAVPDEFSLHFDKLRMSIGSPTIFHHFR